MLGARDEDVRERCLEVYKGKVKSCIYQSEEVNEQFGRKMNQDVNGNRKLFWKEVTKANRENLENCSRMRGWHWKRLKCEGFVRIILRIFIIWIPQTGCIPLVWL